MTDPAHISSLFLSIRVSLNCGKRASSALAISLIGTIRQGAAARGLATTWLYDRYSAGHEDSQREGITPNVVSYWIWTIKESVYLLELSFKMAIETFQEFAGMKGWKIYAGFQSGKINYLHYVLQNDWQPELSYFLVVLNTAAVEGVSVQKNGG